MEQLHLQANLDSFFARLAAAPRRALLLDYDGTLAPFKTERQQAAPYPGVPELLAAVRDAGRTRVVVISGRSVADLGRLLGLDALPELWGSHGWERRLPDGAYQLPTLGEQARAGLEAAYAALAARRLGHMLEQKPASLALHWRGLRRGCARRVAASTASSRLQTGNGRVAAGSRTTETSMRHGTFEMRD